MKKSGGKRPGSGRKVGYRKPNPKKNIVLLTDEEKQMIQEIRLKALN